MPGEPWHALTGRLGWPIPVAYPPGLRDVAGTPPILIVNATNDPSTAGGWARLMREQIDRHTSYLLPGKSEPRDAIDHYLLTGETPPTTV